MIPAGCPQLKYAILNSFELPRAANHLAAWRWDTSKPRLCSSLRMRTFLTRFAAIASPASFTWLKAWASKGARPKRCSTQT